MPVNEWFRDWFSSPFYHKLYFERDEKEAERFIDRLLAVLKPEANARMIDFGCGRGRHAYILAQHGYDVTGVDISFESIAHAQQYSADQAGGLKNLHFYQQDIRLPSWINFFDYAFNFFTSFGYFHTRREHDAALRTISNSLKTSGTIMFDYLNVHYAEAHMKPNEFRQIGQTTYEIHRWHDDHHFYKRIIVTDPSLDQKYEYVEKVAKFILGDFTDMLSFQKMQVTDVFGDYQLSPYHISHTPRMILLGKKA